MKIIFNEDEIKEMILKSDKFKEYFTGKYDTWKDKMSFYGEDGDDYELLFIYNLRIEIEIGG